LLNYVPNGARLLDVGIGNGIMIETFHPLIRSKQLRITGIDIDANYLKHCRELVRKHQLGDFIDVCQEAAESYVAPHEGCFDNILFCLSFMLLRDPSAVLRRAQSWLKSDGQIVFAQAMFRKRSRLVDVVKPKLKYLTTIDFGTAIYEKDFLALLTDRGLSIREDRVLQGEWFHSQCRMIAASFAPSRPVEASGGSRDQRPGISSLPPDPRPLRPGTPCGVATNRPTT
jgi:alpha-N-acetylglucosaminidase